MRAALIVSAGGRSPVLGLRLLRRGQDRRHLRPRRGHACARGEASGRLSIVDGAVPSRRLLEQAVYAAAGVDRGTARISADLLTVSFAFDPARATLDAIHARIEKRLARHGVSLLPFEVKGPLTGLCRFGLMSAERTGLWVARGVWRVAFYPFF